MRSVGLASLRSPNCCSNDSVAYSRAVCGAFRLSRSASVVRCAVSRQYSGYFRALNSNWVARYRIYSTHRRIYEQSDLELRHLRYLLYEFPILCRYCELVQFVHIIVSTGTSSTRSVQSAAFSKSIGLSSVIISLFYLRIVVLIVLTDNCSANTRILGPSADMATLMRIHAVSISVSTSSNSKYATKRTEQVLDAWIFLFQRQIMRQILVQILELLENTCRLFLRTERFVDTFGISVGNLPCSFVFRLQWRLSTPLSASRSLNPIS